MTAAPPTPELPLRLFIIVLAVAAVVSLTIGYLGVSGRLGSGIPGEKPPPPSSSGQLRPLGGGPRGTVAPAVPGLGPARPWPPSP